MKKRRLGKTNLIVSEIGLGCRSIGGRQSNTRGSAFADISEEEAQKLIKFAIDSGINVFDTADSYSTGQSEIRLGKAVAGQRSEVYIFTKAGKVSQIDQNTSSTTNLSFNHLLDSLDKSLKRLNMDYVDLFQTHTIPKTETEIEDVAKAFYKIKSENKARFCGISIGNGINDGLRLIDCDFIDCIQVSFSMMNKDALNELIPKFYKNDIGIIVSRPLAEGFLAKFDCKKQFDVNDLRSTYSSEKIENIEKKIKTLEFLKETKYPLNQIAIKYILSHDQISTCIPSSNSIEQLISNLNSTKTNLEPNLLNKI